MAVSPDLIQLLRELRNVASPRQRIRLMARGWRSLRRLSRTDLQQLAGQLGIEGAEELLRRLARGKGRVETRFLENVLEHVQEPDDVKDYVAALRDPEQGKALVRKGLDAVADELQPDEPASEAGVDSPAPLPQAAHPEPSAMPETRETLGTTEKPSTAAKAIPVATAVSAAALAATPPHEPKNGATPSADGPAMRATPPTPEPPAPPRDEAPATAPAAAQPAVDDRDRGKAEALRPSPVRLVERTAVPPAPPEKKADRRAATRPSRLAEQIGRAETLIGRFRRLNRGIEEARRMDLDQLRAVLEHFPPDWRRRRALNALLRERIPSDLLQAMFLVEGLDSAAAERWCVSTILHSWELADDERRTLRERHAARAS